VLEADGLRPGSPRRAGTFSLRNQTSETLAIEFRAEAAATGLDGLVRVRLSSADATLAATTLQGLRAGSEIPLELASGSAAEVRVEAWIPASIDSGYESRTAAVALIPVSTEVGRR
jgi:hypothetical protein